MTALLPMLISMFLAFVTGWTAGRLSERRRQEAALRRASPKVAPLLAYRERTQGSHTADPVVESPRIVEPPRPGSKYVLMGDDSGYLTYAHVHDVFVRRNVHIVAYKVQRDDQPSPDKYDVTWTKPVKDFLAIYKPDDGER